MDSMEVDGASDRNDETPDDVVLPTAAKKGKAKARVKKSNSARATPTPSDTREGSVASTSHAAQQLPEGTPVRDAVAETDTAHVRVSSVFTSYVPNVADDSDEEEGAQAAKRGRKGKTKLREFGKAEEDEQDDRLYCICRQLYDPDRIMICCDKCEDWYHLDCVGIKEERVELIDDFFCPLCTQQYEIETTYKRRCARPHCLHACSPLSKYCSDYCGIAVAAARISLIDGLEPERLWKKVYAAQRPEVVVWDVEQNKSIDLAAIERKRRQKIVAELEQVVQKESLLESKIELVDKRLQYLSRAIRRWEALCQATADQLASEGITGTKAAEEDETTAATKKKTKKVKTKKPVAATSLPEAQCGFDLHLVDEDIEWVEFVSSDQGRRIIEAAATDTALDDLSGICLDPRKKCDRHQGWQKVREADFEVEKGVIIRRLEQLATRERQLRQRLEELDERVAFREAHAHKTGKALDVRNHIASPSPTRRPTKSPVKTTLNGHSPLKGTTATSAARYHQQAPVTSAPVGEEDMIPDEVWVHLSRSEQAQMRALGRHL